MIDAVLFDMDGLITDSERIALSVIHEAGLAQGYDVPISLINQTIGTTVAFASDVYHSRFPQLDTQRLFLDYRAIMHEKARAGQIPLKKGVKELLNALKTRHIPRAVASSSPLHTIELYLEQGGIRGDFQHLQSGVGGIPSKPAPDIFLLAARALGIAPQHCLVLEDSVNGIMAGRAAGMQVCMVPDLIPFRSDLAPYCDHVKDDLTQVIPLLDG
ncbi:MAG: HAD family phosphatase [Clostridiales bacterium]|nr:HAD family phosphatase [Clostridiales bacterium]